MILHPGVLSLISGSTITLFLLFSAAGLGVKILRRWDVTSSSDEQLLLERRTYLVSTLVQYGLLFEVVSLFLFIYTADDIHNLLVGAMCATGSLNANTYGFPALYAGIASVFLAAGWIALHHLDNRAEDYPLTRRKYALLLFLLPVVLSGYLLQLKYFLSLEPNVITSCCGVLFSEGGSGIGSSLASLPLRTTEVAFFSLYALTTSAGVAALKTGRRVFFVTLSVLSAVFFVVAVTSIISFISLYFYQIPTHHCPFDILQSGYYYVGYPLYASLFTGVFFGVMPGIIEPFRRMPSLAGVIPGTQRRWTLIALCSLAVFVLISLVPMVFSSFTMEGY